MAAENRQEQPGGTDHGHGNLPGNAAGEQQVNAAGDQRDGGGADDTAGEARKQRQQIHRFSRGQLGKGGGGGNTVYAVNRHQAAKGDQQEAAACQGRVHNVVAQAAEEALDHQDCEHGAKNRDVYRHLGRQGQGQQQAGDHSGAIIHRVFPVGCQVKQIFRHHGAAHAQGNHQECGEAVDPNAHNGGGEQGDQHIGHNALCGQRAAHMGG